jgi:hypothetical protein
MEEVIMATRTLPNGFFGWTWSAVLAGVFSSLVVQILLTMLGLGIGLIAIDVPTAASAPATSGWAAFVWWSVSGIIAAFIGGAVAAANSPDQTGLGRVGPCPGCLVGRNRGGGRSIGTDPGFGDQHRRKSDRSVLLRKRSRCGFVSQPRTRNRRRHREAEPGSD